MSIKLDETRLTQSIKEITDPVINRPLGSLKMVGPVSCTEGMIPSITIMLPSVAYPQKEALQKLIEQTVSQLAGETTVCDIKYEVRTQGKQTGGSIGLNVKNVIAVGSGKGGVGKSTVATGIAIGLKHLGAKVGLLDADVYGPSIPHMLGSDGKPTVVQAKTQSGEFIERIQPVDFMGMPLMSIGFMVEPEKAVIWRGPMLHKLLTQFLKDTDWGELDYLIIDLPPGTGDVSLTLSQMLGLAGAVVVCTPQKVALLDAVKAVKMYQTLEIPVLGMVENMSGDVFGRGGAAAKAEELGIPFLGEIPSDSHLRVIGDDGEMSKLFSQESPSQQAMLNVIQNVTMQIIKDLSDKPAMPTLEILQ